MARTVRKVHPSPQRVVLWEWRRKCGESRISLIPASRAVRVRVTHFHALTALIRLSGMAPI